MKLFFASLLISTVAFADNGRGLGTPFVDATAQKFVATYPKAGAAIQERDLDELMFPGGEVCDVAQSATSGQASAIAASPDGKTLVVITTAKLDKKMAKSLGLKSHDPNDVALVAIVTDGPLHKVWTAELVDGSGCGRGATTFTWRADGKTVLAVSGDSNTVIDLAAHTARDVPKQ